MVVTQPSLAAACEGLSHIASPQLCGTRVAHATIPVENSNAQLWRRNPPQLRDGAAMDRNGLIRRTHKLGGSVHWVEQEGNPDDIKV